MLNDALLANVVVLILANKQDLPKAASPSAMTDQLKLREFKQQWKVQGTPNQAFRVVPRFPYPDSQDCNCRFVPHCQVAAARREMGCTQAWTGSQTTCPQRHQEERVLSRSSLLACGWGSVFPPFSWSVVASRSILLVLNSVKCPRCEDTIANLDSILFYFNWKTFSTIFTLFNLHQSLSVFILFLEHAQCRLNPHKSIYVGSTYSTRVFDRCWPWFVFGKGIWSRGIGRPPLTILLTRGKSKSVHHDSKKKYLMNRVNQIIYYELLYLVLYSSTEYSRIRILHRFGIEMISDPDT